MGASEVALGNKSLADEFIVTTKAITGQGDGTGKRDHILQNAKDSLEALKVDKVSVFDIKYAIGMLISTSRFPSTCCMDPTTLSL
jgi:aryl-alcohol dehydrogenase-like predicted oxidoreductase